MNLDGKFFAGEKKFNKEWKGYGLRIEAGPGPFGGHCWPRFTQFFSGERAGGEATFVAGEPGFAEWLSEIGFFRKQRREIARAPRTRAENRLKPSGTERRPAAH
jgi:hypothetical protein